MPDPSLPIRRALCALALFTAGVAHAHPEVEEALADLAPQIAAHPRDAGLRLRRAAVYQRHGDTAAAEADLQEALSLAPRSTAALLQATEFYLQQRRLPAAETAVNQVLALAPDDAEALVWRARISFARGRLAAADADYARAISRLPQPPPELYLEWATLPAAPERALAVLDAGLARLGPLLSLTSRAIDLELKLGHTDAALARVDTVLPQVERKGLWLSRRADILAGAGRTAEARAAYRVALESLRQEPAWLRNANEEARLVTAAAQLRP